MEQIGDELVMRDMLVMLKEMLERDVPEIARLLASQDIASANKLLHMLKGCMPIFACNPLCERLVGVEALSKVGPSAQLLEGWTQLMPDLLTLLAEVNQHLDAPRSTP
jgi:hypothetical protein